MPNNRAVYTLVLSIVITGLAVQYFPQIRPVTVLTQILALTITAQVLWSKFIYPVFFSPLRHIPGPKYGNPLYGHAIQARMSMPRGKKAREWMETIPNDGLLRFRDILNNEALILTSPMMLKAVLNDKPYDYVKQRNSVNALRPVLGDGLVLVEGEVHKFQRKHLQPAFSGHHTRELYPMFWNKACELTQLLSESVNEPEIELGLWSTRVTLDIIGIAGLGRDFHSLTNHSDPFVATYQEVLEVRPIKAFFFILNLIFPSWLIRHIPFWSLPRDLKRVSTTLYQFGRNLASTRRSEFAAASNPKTQEDDPRHDILSLLVKSNDFSDHELAHQILTFLAAGHETTSSTLSWCIYLLALHPPIQTSLRSEIRSSLPCPSTTTSTNPPTTDTNTTSSSIDTLPLLNAVVAETLRLYPVVPITSRVSIKPTTLGQYTIPVGTNIYIVPWAINRSTKFWGLDAEKFTPARWIDTNEKGEERGNGNGGCGSSWENMTFLGGPRSCIGQGFARAELKHLLAALVGRYEFSLSRDEGTYYPGGIVTSKPAKGMWVRIKRVEGW